MKEQKRWITLLDVIDHEDNGFLYLLTTSSVSGLGIDGRWKQGRIYIPPRCPASSSAFFRVITLIIRIDFHWELLSLDTQVGSFLGLYIC